MIEYEYKGIESIKEFCRHPNDYFMFTYNDYEQSQCRYRWDERTQITLLRTNNGESDIRITAEPSARGDYEVFVTIFVDDIEDHWGHLAFNDELFEQLAQFALQSGCDILINDFELDLEFDPLSIWACSM